MADRGSTLLVVEDDTLLASYLALALIDHGFRVLGPASSVTDAMHILDEAMPDAAVLDFQLADSTSEPVLAALEDRAVPVCVMSGNLREDLPHSFASHPVLHKPFGADELIERLGHLLAN